MGNNEKEQEITTFAFVNKKLTITLCKTIEKYTKMVYNIQGGRSRYMRMHISLEFKTATIMLERN